MFEKLQHSKTEIIPTALVNGIQLSVKREDLLHPKISGNKWRKLKYNVLAAKQAQKTSIITFGGAYSNHISAVAAVGKESGFQTIGYIRGEELANKVSTNPTLQFAQDMGMELRFLEREVYRQKEDPKFLEHLLKEESNYYVLPEGGTNNLAFKGCREILVEKDEIYDYICTAVGTGGTMIGLVQSAKCSSGKEGKEQQVLGFPALKGAFLKAEIAKHVGGQSNWDLMNDYHFGGYAKINADLISFINMFKAATSIPLDPVYTGKMMYGILDLAKKGFFKSDAKVLAIHTGGLQGIAGMNLRLAQKGMTLLK